MYSTYRDHTGKLKVMIPWEKRLASLAMKGKPDYCKYPPNGMESSLWVGGDGEDYEIDVVVDGDYEPAERGGMWSPSYSAYYTGITAWFHRKGKGWKEVTLTGTQEEAFADRLLEQRKDNYDGPDDYDRDVPDYYDGTGRF